MSVLIFKDVILIIRDNSVNNVPVVAEEDVKIPIFRTSFSQDLVIKP